MTGPENLDNRRNITVLVQAAIVKRLENRPVHKRMAEPTKCRLKKASFIHDVHTFERQDPELLQHVNKKITSHRSLPAWKRELFPEIRDSIPGTYPMGIQTKAERKAVTLDLEERAYREENWTHAYAGGSEETTRNEGGGMYIFLNNRTTIQRAIPTGKFSTNYKAEAHALQAAVKSLL